MHYDTRLSTRASRISIKIEPPDKVVVVAPRKASAKTIKRFVESQADWIKAQLIKVKQKQLLIESESQVMIFGKNYQKKYQFNPELPIGIFTNQLSIIFNFPGADSQQNLTTVNRTLNKTLTKELEIFLKKTARSYLQKQTKILADKMQVSYHSLTLRNQKTRWGSCSSNGNLSLNWRLVHYPSQIIDYVIIHELAHLTHHNHSKKFWQCVAQHDPEFKLHRNYLKKHGVSFS